MPAPARYFVESPGNTILADHYNSELNNLLSGFVPANFTAVSTNVTNWRADTDPGEVGSESLPTNTTGEINRLKKLIKEITAKTYAYQSPSLTLSKIYPVGTVLPFYDFNAAVSFDTNVWAYCNGTTISDSASPLNGLTLPNLSGRYIVGFGTEGGTDIGSATWNSTVVGSNLKDLSHTHNTSNHTHGYAHTHESGTLQFRTIDYKFIGFFPAPVGTITGYDSSGAETTIYNPYLFATNGGSITVATNLTFQPVGYTANGSGATASTNAATGASGAVASSSGLSAVQDVRPSSVRFRYIVRYK